MATDQSPGNRQLPAVHPKLANYVDTAAACLKSWARANGQNWDALTDPDALLLQTLLAKSRPESKRGVVPILPLSDFKDLLNESLTERRWEKFLRWFSREVSSELAKACGERSEPMLYPARSSSGTGGRGPKGQAIYFLSFEPPPLLTKSRTFHFPDEEPMKQSIQGPAAAEPFTGFRADTPSQDTNKTTAGAATCASEDLPRSCEAETAPKHAPRSLDKGTPLEVLIGPQSSTSNDTSIGWVFAFAVVVFFIATATPASTLLTDEMARALMAVREALAGALVVRL